MTQPWSNQAVSLIVLQAGTGFSGLFIYSGPPGLGNLSGSFTTQSGTDPFGNTYQGSGPFTYYYHHPGSAQGFAGITGNELIMQDWGGKIQCFFQFTGGDFATDGAVLPALFANAGVVGGTWGNKETWHAVTGGVGYQNGWSDSGTGPGMQYRLNAAPVNTVDLVGDMSAGTLTSPTTIFTLPAAYRPANVQTCLPVASGGGAGLVVGTSRIVFNVNGTVTATGMAGFTAGGRIFVRYSLALDA